MNNIKITAKKELRSIFRDKKTLILLFTLPIMIPVLIFFYGYTFDNMEEDLGGNIRIGITYELSSEEEEILNSLGIIHTKYESLQKAKEAYQGKEIDVYVTKKDNFYRIYANEGNQSGQIAISMVSAYIEEYNHYLGEEYVTDNGLDPEKVFNILSYDVKNTTNIDYFLNLIYNIAFTYTIMGIVIAAGNMAMSATATEKENGTLETILTLPITTKELIIGKHVGAAIMSFLVSLFSLIITIISLLVGYKMFESFKTFDINISFITIFLALIVIISASILISGIALALTAMCKTTKEAQSKTQLLNFLCLAPLFISLMGVETSKYFYLIPICNYIQTLLDIFNNNINLINIFIVFASSIIYIAIIINVIIRLYKSEKVLFTN